MANNMSGAGRRPSGHLNARQPSDSPGPSVRQLSPQQQHQPYFAENARNPPPEVVNEKPDGYDGTRSRAASVDSILSNQASGAPTIDMADDERGLDGDAEPRGAGRFAPQQRIMPVIPDPVDWPWYRNIFLDHWKTWLGAIGFFFLILAAILVAVGCTGGFTGKTSTRR
jgi:hypothetical protein